MRGGDVDGLFASSSARVGSRSLAKADDGVSIFSSQSVGTVQRPAAELTKQYLESNRLDFGDRIGDGFCDEAGDKVLVDRGSDEKLAEFLHKAQNKLQKASDPVTSLMVMALLVSEACGRSGSHAADLPNTCAKLLQEGRQSDGRISLGSLMAWKEKKRKVSGGGLARHRALTFKVLADTMGAESTLERDTAQNTAWNRVKVEQVDFVVDLMHDPGALYEYGSAKQQEYHRLLSDGKHSDNTTQMMTISMRQELPGHVPRPSWHVESSDLVYGRGQTDCLGKGGFGEVYKGTWSDFKVAIKVVKDKEPTDYDILDFILEIALLSRLNHPNVMRFWRGCAELNGGRRSLLMVTEYIEHGGLSTLLHGHGGAKLPEALTLPQVLNLAIGTARGMQYLHACKVLHLDMKSPNVLVDSSWNAKLCDFGLAKIKGQETDEGGFQTTLRGVSPIWAPPEMFDDRAEAYSEKADVYSYGIVFFELICRKLPFQEVNQRQLPKLKYEGTLPQIPKEVPSDCSDLINSCCSGKPAARPSMSGVVARLLEMAAQRNMDLMEIVMPSWNKGKVDKAAEEEDMRKIKERKNTLAKEKAALQAQLEQIRDRRRRIQEKHLGPGHAEDPLGMDQNAASSGAGDGASASKTAATTPAGADAQKKGCCSLQ